MFEHIRRAKLPIHQAILPKDKSIYMNYLAQRHNNAYRYIPVYENDHHRCDAFLYTITRKNECYVKHIGYKLIGLPFYYQIFIIFPILKYFTPNWIYKLYHKRG